MKLRKLCTVIYSLLFCSCSSLVFAASQHPAGEITFYNASNKTVTAQVSSYGKINLPAKEQKAIKYSSLSQACSGQVKACTAQFYVDNYPAGTATINVETGKLLSMNMTLKVHTTKGPQKVLRGVVIQ